MKTFTDNAGNQWLVDVNVNAVERVRAACGVDFLEAVDPQAHLFERLAADPVLLVGVLWTLCGEQATQKEVAPEAFGRAMGGDALDAACEALVDSLVDFFPRLRRQLLSKAVEKMTALQERAFAAAGEYLDSPEMEAHLKTRLEELKRSFGGALESSGSIPGAGPSAGSSTLPRPASEPISSAAPG